MTDPKYGAVVTSESGTGSLRFMLIAPDPHYSRADRDPWLVYILIDHNGGTMYGGVGAVTTVTHVGHPDSAWQEPVS